MRKKRCRAAPAFGLLVKWKEILLLLTLNLCWNSVLGAAPSSHTDGVPILVYHRFGPAVLDSMTVRTDTFAWQLRYLKEHGYTVISLHGLVDYLRGASDAPPPKSVVITADDGHASVYSDMLPLVRQSGIHVTLFIYPSAISNAAYALTWSQLAELAHTGQFDVQSHTYWHPNFHIEKKRLAPQQYAAFVDLQLVKSRQVLESRLGAPVDLLAWPFGIYDDNLMTQAREAGYIAAFSIEDHPVTRSDELLALPRHLMTDRDAGAAFRRILGER
jgi:peptidoglycan/xylan/chitin deacetylase (PgdA/CDA1 family)